MATFSQLLIQEKKEISASLGSGILNFSSENIPFSVAFSHESILDSLHELPAKQATLSIYKDHCQRDIVQELEKRGYRINIITQLPSKSRLNEWMLFDPSPPLLQYIDLIDPQPCQVSKTVIDVGCGSGRDLKFLQIRQRWYSAPEWNCIAIDHDTTKLAHVKAQKFQLRLLGDGTIRTFQNQSFDLNIKADLVMFMRFLPPSLDHVLQFASCLKKNGWFIMYHFVDDGIDGTWYMSKNQKSAKFSHPKYPHILARNQLSRLFAKQDMFKIVLDKVEYLDDSRPVQWFIAQKIYED